MREVYKIRELEEFVLHIVKSLVDHPERVGACVLEGRDTLVVEITVAGEDFGKVIGKGGRVVEAIEILIKAAAKVGKRVFVEIMK